MIFSLALICAVATAIINGRRNVLDVNSIGFRAVSAATVVKGYSRSPKWTLSRHRHRGLMKTKYSTRLGECEGDCGGDRDCDWGLVCFQQQPQQDSSNSNSSINNVPGCDNDMTSLQSLLSSSNAGNLCYRPPPGHVVLVGQDNEPKEAFPLGECEGHCSTDSDCDAGSNLRCFRRPAAAPESDIPGCTGGMGDLESNYCSAVTYLPGHLTIFQKGLQLSQGLACRIIATSGQNVQYDTNDGGRSYSKRVFHKLPDGAAVFADKTTGGWMYVSNSEGDDWSGGVGGITFDYQGRVIGYKRLLSGTRRNCGGGKTYWNTWLSCEEVGRGKVWEIDPFGKNSSTRRRTIMGGSDGAAYESAAYDNRNPNDPKFFLTVDMIDGALVRFSPDADAVQYAVQTGDYSQLLHTNGTSSRRDYLVLTYTNNSNNNNDTAANSTTKFGTFAWTTDFDEAKLNARTFYRESEGLDVRNGKLYMTTKRDKLLFILDLDKFTFESSSTKSGAFDRQPDQIRSILQDEEGKGKENSDPDILYFCEDGASHAGVHGRDSNGKFYTILTATEAIPGESSGLAFSPDNRFMYVSYQEAGLIYEIRRTDGFPFGGQRLDIKYHEG